jgi:hypothetical protein
MHKYTFEDSEAELFFTDKGNDNYLIEIHFEMKTFILLTKEEVLELIELLKTRPLGDVKIGSKDNYMIYSRSGKYSAIQLSLMSKLSFITVKDGSNIARDDSDNIAEFLEEYFQNDDHSA